MIDEADALAEMARNRGFKLVRSRVRTPTKRAFGKYGLKDSKGDPVLGLDGKHPSASADEVETFLRKGLVSEWAGSLGVTPSAARKPRKVVPKPAPPPPPKPVVREAKVGDAGAIVALMALLQHDADMAGVRRRLKIIPIPQLVGTIANKVVGLCGLDVETHVHRPAPVGRITIMVVAKGQRGDGVGRLLVEEAEARLKALGCTLIEVTSNERHAAAHPFYVHLGFGHTGKRFAKTL